MKTMNALLLAVVLSCLGLPLYAVGQDWLWAARFGGTESDMGNCLALDYAGNIYTAGEFSGSWSYGYSYLNSAGGNDIFIAKTYTGGTPHWAKRAGSTEDDCAYGVVLDSLGNIYITGYFRQSVAFGATTLTSEGSADVFVAKLDASGAWQWAVRAGGEGGDLGRGISLDAAGNIYVTGHYNDTAIFGSTTLSNTGGDDFFVAKLNNAGSWQWARKLGTVGYDAGLSICADPAGGAIVSGYFNGTMSVGTVAVLLSAGESDAFAARISSSGNWSWAKRAGGENPDRGCGITRDATGNTYITGYFRGTADFGATSLTSAGNDDLFVAKLDAAGAWQWAARGGGTSNDAGYCLATDSEGCLYVGGMFGSTGYFGPDTVYSAGGADALALKLEGDGTWKWVKRAGGALSDHVFGIAVDELACIYLTGNFGETADFGATTLTSLGFSDVFVAKLAYQIPRAPQNLAISISGDDIVLTWSPVTTSIWNEPLTPDFYVVWRSLSAPDANDYSMMGISYGTSYNGTSEAGNPHPFYKVTAYVDEEE